jgi:GNAT superfamily N-acetyltransferase
MANVPPGLILQWLTEPSMVDARARHQLLSCWRDVSNAGGAVGFPFLPVEDAQVLPAVDAMVDSLDPLVSRLLLATVGESLAGWLLLAGNTAKVTAHWARVLRVQTAIAHRGTGIGRSMLTEVSRAARDDLGLQQLHLELRGGLGLESFYGACGWREVGRWPAALRLSGDDYRDEVLMVLELQ